MPVSQSADVLTRSQRLVSGLAILLAVDVIWVASSEFTEYIFHELNYEKPFFSTYFKTSLFMIYLTGFVVYRPWRERCSELTLDETSSLRRQRYERVNEDPDDTVEAVEDEDDDEDEGGEEEQRSLIRSLSSPTWVPVNIPESGKSSGTESDGDTGSRRVRFKRVAQVVEMNPSDALYANLARLSYNASLRAQTALQRAASRLSVKEVMQLAMLFCLPWFLGNYCYQLALSDTEAAVVNVLSSSSCLFTLVLAAIFPSEDGDKFTLSKFLAICFNVAGVVLVSYSDLDLESGFPKGAVWTLVGALFYSIYIVLLRRRVHHEDNMDSPMFFGFVGCFNALVLWPGLLVLHFGGTEEFVLPTGKQWQFLIINGLIGTVLSELLWLWGCFYTSSLVATLAISLNIPLTILADILWKNKRYGPIFFVGAVPMFLSFFIVAMLTHYQDWDPILDLVKAFYRKCRPLVAAPASRDAQIYDRQESESLISQESSQEEL